MKYPASKFIPGLGTQFFINPNHVNAKGGAEKYIPGLGSQVEVKLSEVNAKGGAEKYVPGLGTQFFIHPDHVEPTPPAPAPTYTVTLTVVFEEAPIADVDVTIGGVTVTSDEEGIVVFTLPDGTHSYTLENSGGAAGSGTVVVNGANVTAEVEVEPN
jgi:hypothetical protein